MTQISIAMATYNGGQFLAEQLESLASQRLLPAELQVGDDASTDDTLEILKSFSRTAPFPVTITRNEPPLGYGENFMRAAARCKSEWIAFCDQDDIWYPEKLERCAREIERGLPDLMLVAHNVIFGGEGVQPKLMDKWPARSSHKRLSLQPDWFTLGFRQVFRRTLIEKIPTRPRKMRWCDFEEAHDVWISLMANAIGSIVLLGEPLATYRRHGANTTELWTPPPDNALARIRATIANNGEAYLSRSEVVGKIAEFIARLVPLTRDEAFSARLREAAIEIDSFARDLRRRSLAYEGKAISTRLRHIAQLAQSGRYSHAHWSFGPRAFIKDAASVFLH